MRRRPIRWIQPEPIVLRAVRILAIADLVLTFISSFTRDWWSTREPKPGFSAELRMSHHLYSVQPWVPVCYSIAFWGFVVLSVAWLLLFYNVYRDRWVYEDENYRGSPGKHAWWKQ